MFQSERMFLLRMFHEERGKNASNYSINSFGCKLCPRASQVGLAFMESSQDWVEKHPVPQKAKSGPIGLEHCLG